MAHMKCFKVTKWKIVSEEQNILIHFLSDHTTSLPSFNIGGLKIALIFSEFIHFILYTSIK